MKRKRRKIIVKKICVACGKEFFLERNSPQKYCSRKCGQTYRSSQKTDFSKGEVWVFDMNSEIWEWKKEIRK